MAIKIDFEKAYDQMEWSFIRDTLNLFRFPKHHITLIMSYAFPTHRLLFFLMGEHLTTSILQGALDRGTPFPLTCSCFVWRCLEL